MVLENQKRLVELKKQLTIHQIEVAIITSPASVFYYTQFYSNPGERFMALVIDQRTDIMHLFVPALDYSIAEGNHVVQSIIPISDEEDPFTKVHKTINRDVKQLGIEMKQINAYTYKQFQQTYPSASCKDIEPIILKQRMKKSRNEIKHAQKAVDIIENVLSEGLKKVRIGMSELELTAELEYLMRTLGADRQSFSSIVLSGEKSALPHGTPGNRQLQRGDFLLIDFGVIKDRYCSDITRTFLIGEASEKQKEIYDIVLQANKAGIDAVEAGVPLNTFDLAARDIITKSGYGEYFRNRVGHGLGLEIHEEPSVHSANTTIAEKGLLFTIEPGIYIPGFGGVRIEDEVYINEEGDVEVLTSFPKELQIL